MNELVAALAHTAAALGAHTELAWDAFPPIEQSLVYVVIPHEFYACTAPEAHPTKEQERRTIAFCVEQPGTHWFELSVQHAARAAAIFDIHRNSVRELSRRGLNAEHFRLGYTDYWDRWSRDETAERSVDVLFMGAANERRCRVLAEYARTLWPYETRLLIPPEAPKSEGRPDFLVDEAKWECLRSSKMLLNVHRRDTPYFEWVRVLEAVANGCVVVSEHSLEVAPLQPGEHLVVGTAGNLAVLAETVLQDEDRLMAMRTTAYDFVRSELPMSVAAEQLLAVADSVRRGNRRARQHTIDSARPAVKSVMGWGNDRARQLVKRALLREPTLARLMQFDTVISSEFQRLSSFAKRLELNDVEFGRLLKMNDARMRGIDPDEVHVIHETPAYSSARPRLSVLVPVYNHGDQVRRALASVVVSDEHLEVLVLDDGSTDASSKVVIEFLTEQASIPGVVLRHPVNRGLPRTRNELVARARGEFVFPLDADNEVYPTAFSRLLAALERDPDAFFAYSILEEHSNGVSTGLRSMFPWEPARLRAGNYIDAMSLLRRDRLRDIGGYTEDIRLFGWEDYDLWCRCAEHGWYGILVPQILGRYQCSAHSMLSITDMDDTEARSILRDRYPMLWASAFS